MNRDIGFLPWVWGFTASAENWNGRLAMLGFFFTVMIEAITGKGVLHFVGFL